MSNTSHKYRNKKIWIWGIIIVVLLLVVSFVVSKGNKQVDPASFTDVETFDDSPHIKGDPNAEIVLIEYSDFQCPACKAAAPAVADLVDVYGDRLAIEYRNFPLRQIHPNAQVGAQAAEAAAIQGKFWEMHDLLFERQSEWAESFNPERYFRDYAQELGLNGDRFRYDFGSDEVKNRVNTDADEAMALEVPGTPGLVYNGEVIDMNTFLAENFAPVVVEESTTE